MADFELYYWSIPFRGQFVRALLAFAGAGWTEAGDAAIARLMSGPVADMPVPFMGPPLLKDLKTGVAVAQMPAIVLYLGETLGLLPNTPPLRALTMKVVNDANDVIDDLTLDGGRLMWTPTRWGKFRPRLEKWMSLWEDTGRRHGLTAGSGHLLGETRPGVADVVTAVLWSTMAERLPEIGDILDHAAPATAGLTRRVASLKPLADLARTARQEYGDDYCGGRIEASLRRVLSQDDPRPFASGPKAKT